MSTFSILSILIILILLLWIGVLYVKLKKKGECEKEPTKEKNGSKERALEELDMNNPFDRDEYTMRKTIAMMQAMRESKSVAALDGVNEQKAKQKNERKEEILKLVGEKGKVSNNDIETLLGVSDSTATAYLDELEKEGKIRQIGETGHAVFYELNG